MKKFLSAALALLMLVSLLPMSVIATAAANGLPDDMTIIEDVQSTLAPGITQREVVVFDKNNNRVEMYVAVADTSIDTVNIYANYKDNQNEVLGMQKTTDQVAAAEAKHEEPYNVVVAINASYYNTSNGKPTGAFVMEGNDVTTESQGNAYPFFAVLKDGTVMIGSKGEYSSYKGQIAEAIGGYIHLVKDGKICSGLDASTKYPRQTIGLTADGQVILMTADGNQAPRSDGLTVQEQAEVMLAMGCVEALHLDGGGSATYCSKAEGSDKLVVTNSPSNGSERSVSNTLMFVSTAVADGTFDHATLSVDHTYITANASATVSAVGVDAAGGAAEIPENATYQLKDSTSGTMNGNVFTPATTGDAVIQMIVDGVVVGETTVHVVVPDGLSFGKEQLTVPYGKTVNIGVAATYGVNEVEYSAKDIAFTLADSSAGTINGLEITAPDADSSVTDTTMTATLVADSTVTASVAVKYGKGSDVVFDFEAGTASAEMDNWIVRTHESKSDWNELGEAYIVTEETGLVHSGEQALAFHTDFSQTTCSGSNTTGYHALSLSWAGDAVSVKGAQRIGFWLYIPEDAMSTEITINTFYTDSKGVIQRRTLDGVDDNGEYIYTPYWSQNMEGSGWQYVSIDTSKLTDDLFIHDEPGYTGGAYKRNFFIKLYAVTGPDTLNFPGHHGDFTYYIDDITVDYSDAVEDRELPVFGNVTAYGVFADKTMSYGEITALTENSIIFGANVADNTNKANYTGLNASTAKVYVDGNEVKATYSDGVITSDNVELADGYHRIKFEIADNNGNVKAIVREVEVTANSDKATVELVPHDATLDRLLSGSVYWVDLTTDNLSALQSVETTLNLNSINTWELEHMVVANGFDVSYTSTAAQDKENIVEVTFTRNGGAVDSASNILASIPVRVWDSRIHEYSGHSAKTPEYMWTAGNLQFKQVIVTAEQGLAVFTNETNYFSGNIEVDHESYTHYYNMDTTYHTEKGTYHVHTAEAIDDKAATCTEDGYTGRTYCEDCDSVVDWGETVPATGHNFAVVDGKFVCDICKETDSLTGLYTDKTGTYYVVNGVAQKGWQYVDSAWYYFDSTTCAGLSGELTYGPVTYTLTDGKLDSGVWAKTLYGYRYYYGPDYYKNAFQTIDGKEYYFDGGYRLEGGWQLTLDMSNEHKWYYFDENGVCDKDAVIEDGFYTDRNGYAYAKDGKGVRGLQLIDGTYYYFNWDGYAVTGTYAERLFGEDYKAVTGLMETDNGLVYYKNGRPNMAGLIEIDGDYYFAKGGGEIVTGSYYVWQGNGILPEGDYEFGADGKMLQGIVEKDGTLYYYENGKGTMAGLINIDGDYYFAGGAKGEITVNEYKYVWNANGLLPEREYHFGPDGKMLNGIAENADGVLCYYENGVAKMAGLINIDGDYYFANGVNGEITVNEYKYVWKSNGLLPEREYHFGPDGKMLNGIVEREDGVLCYYETGVAKMAGLINIDGDYYFAGGAKGEITVNEYKYVWNANGLLPEREYHFGPDGKMLNGIVEREDGVLCYYETGVAKMAGLINIDGDYYFAGGAKGEITVNEYKYVWKPNGLLPAAEYEFGADGKMLQGIVEKDGTLYYYKNGKGTMAGLVEVDGDYYFAGGANGEITVNETKYVWKANGILPEAEYEFGADGKMLNGFVTKADGLYYYENGKPGTVGLNYIDGYYYFVDYNGKLTVNKTQYVWETNGYTIEMNYYFDELGRAVL